MIAGSNASLLNGKIGTRLTGRSGCLSYTLFPLPNTCVSDGSGQGRIHWHIPEEKVKLTTAFTTYRETGGCRNISRTRMRDISRHSTTISSTVISYPVFIRRQRLLRELVGILLSTISLPFTYNSLKKSLGLSNAITVKEYISYLGSAYLFFELARFDYSVKKQLNAPRKIYVIDTAFSILGGFSLSPDKGRHLENIVFIELKRRGRDIFYHSGTRECDFIVKNDRSITDGIQVCHELNERNMEREFEGLLEAMEKFNLDGGLILTADQEDTRMVGDRMVSIMPVWKWLLGEGAIET